MPYVDVLHEEIPTWLYVLTACTTVNVQLSYLVSSP